MEEAALELRNAVHLALSLDPSSNDNNDHHRNDELLNNDIQAGAGSSEGTYISSLSGSLPSDRSIALASRRKNYFAANGVMGAVAMDDDANATGNNGYRAWPRRCLHVAKCVENAVSNYELAVFSHHNEAMSPQHHNSNETNDGDIVDLLVAVLTSVPRNLFQRLNSMGESVHSPHQEDEDCISSMEQVCYNAACISSDIIRKNFLCATLNMEHPMLEDRHIDDLIDEVVQICNDETPIGSWSRVDPVVRLINSLSEGREIDRCIREREQGSCDGEDGYETLFSRLSSTESLRLANALMYRFLCEREDPNVEPSSHVGYFISYLLGHFASISEVEMGYNSTDERTVGLFEVWADEVDQHMVKRLNEGEARDTYTFIVRYHFATIQSALHLIENAESFIGDAISASEKNDGVDESAVESLSVELQDSIRHMAMVVATAEVMDKLSLDHDPEIHDIIRPLITSYTRFIASSLHDAMLFLRSACDSSHGGEEISILADDLLFRLCRVTIGFEFLRNSSEGEVIAIPLLRAMNSRCIVGKARFLLDIAAHRVSVTEKVNISNNGQPVSKRQRLDSSMGYVQLPPDRHGPSEGRGEDMVDVMLACLAFTRSNQEDRSLSARQASCITSALMFSEEGASDDGHGRMAAISTLNPWHTLQVKHLQKLANSEPYSRDNEEALGDSYNTKSSTPSQN